MYTLFPIVLTVIFFVSLTFCGLAYLAAEYVLGFWFGFASLISLLLLFIFAPEGSYLDSVKKTLDERSQEQLEYRKQTVLVKEIDGCKIYKFLDDSTNHGRLVYFTKCPDGSVSVK